MPLGEPKPDKCDHGSPTTTDWCTACLRGWGWVDSRDLRAVEKERDAALLQIDEANGRYDRAFDAAQKYRAALEKIDAMRKRLPDPDFAEQKNTAAGIAEIIQSALTEKPKDEKCPICDLPMMSEAHREECRVEKRNEGRKP